MQRHLVVGLGALVLTPGCGGPAETPLDAVDRIDLTESFSPGSNLDDDAPGDSTPSAWSDRIDARTYRIDLLSFETSVPEGLFELIAIELGIAPLVMVSSSSASSIGLLASVAAPGSDDQYPCVPTDALSGSFSAAPAFSASVATGHMAMPDWSSSYLSTESVALSGTFSDSGEELLDVRYSALVDFRTGSDAWRDIVGDDDPDTLCDLLLSFGTGCVACADGQPYCMEVGFGGAEARAIDGLTLAPLTAAEAECR